MNVTSIAIGNEATKLFSNESNRENCNINLNANVERKRKIAIIIVSVIFHGYFA